MNKLEDRMMKSAEELSDYIIELTLTSEQKGELILLIQKHIDDYVRWGVQVKLGYMLEEMGENE